LSIGGNVLASTVRDTKDSAVIYNASLTHHFTDDMMAYVSSGSSFRPGLFAIGVFRDLTPRLRKFIDLDAEKSKSYELGFKAALLDKRLRLNAAVFQQDFKDFLYRGSPVFYVNIDAASGQETVSQFNFVANVDTRVRGVEVEAAYDITRRFNIGAVFSYAKGKIKNDFIACNDLDGDGEPDGAILTPPTVAEIRAGAGGEDVAQCRVNDRTSFSPDWSTTVQSEYFHPITSGADGFVRGLLSYYPKNERDPNNPRDTVKAHGLLNLYGGLRAPNGAWEVSLFAKNLTKTHRVLSRAGSPVTTSTTLLGPTFTPIGSRTHTGEFADIRTTAPREFGLNIRYAFGSR
jgi:iron complex outermembrane recepter protein